MSNKMTTVENDKAIADLAAADITALDEEEANELLLQQDFIEAPADKYFKGTFFQLDKSTVNTHIFGVIAYTVLIYWQWNSLCRNAQIVAIILWFFWFVQIMFRRDENMLHVSSEAASKHRARESCIVLLSIVVLYSAFHSDQQECSVWVGSAAVSLLIGSFWFTHKDTPAQYRNRRNIHVTAITLSVMCMIIMFVSKCFCANQSPVIATAVPDFSKKDFGI